MIKIFADDQKIFQPVCSIWFGIFTSHDSAIGVSAGGPECCSSMGRQVAAVIQPLKVQGTLTSAGATSTTHARWRTSLPWIRNWEILASSWMFSSNSCSGDIITANQLLQGGLDVDPHSFFEMSQAISRIRCNSFSIWVIHDWNSLPAAFTWDSALGSGLRVLTLTLFKGSTLTGQWAHVAHDTTSLTQTNSQMHKELD